LKEALFLNGAFFFGGKKQEEREKKCLAGTKHLDLEIDVRKKTLNFKP
jgi:hypothetical protein